MFTFTFYYSYSYSSCYARAYLTFTSLEYTFLCIARIPLIVASRVQETRKFNTTAALFIRWCWCVCVRALS